MSLIECLSLLAVALLTLSVVPCRAETRRALVIGIGRQLDSSWPEIHGDRDVPLVVDMLEECGFTDISTLTDEAATKKSITDAFTRLSSACSAGDLVYVHFSGHGQWMTDIDGDEPDGWDESWIPYDAYRTYCDKDRGDRHLCDDELAVLLQSVRDAVGREGNVIVVVDACHSGDSTRKPSCGKTDMRGVYEKFIIPGRRHSGGIRHEENWLTLSACKDYQMNQEHPSGYGKLTCALTSLWKRLAGCSNEQVLAEVEAYMQRHDVRGRYPQSPVMTGLVDVCRFSMIFDL